MQSAVGSSVLSVPSVCQHLYSPAWSLIRPDAHRPAKAATCNRCPQTARTKVGGAADGATIPSRRGSLQLQPERWFTVPYFAVGFYYHIPGLEP